MDEKQVVRLVAPNRDTENKSADPVAAPRPLAQKPEPKPKPKKS